jgi:hypothetical protein
MNVWRSFDFEVEVEVEVEMGKEGVGKKEVWHRRIFCHFRNKSLLNFCPRFPKTPPA